VREIIFSLTTKLQTNQKMVAKLSK